MGSQSFCCLKSCSGFIATDQNTKILITVKALHCLVPPNFMPHLPPSFFDYSPVTLTYFNIFEFAKFFPARISLVMLFFLPGKLFVYLTPTNPSDFSLNVTFSESPFQLVSFRALCSFRRTYHDV